MKKKNKLPQIKKDIKDFLLKEEGKIVKKDIVKIGISVAVLGMVLKPTDVSAAHSSSIFTSGRGGHTSHSSHSSHSSHGSHGSTGGWC